MRLLSQVLNWYREEKCYDFVVPLTKRHRTRCRVIPGRDKSRPDQHFMQADEIRRWMDALKEYQVEVYHDLALFMILTGTRLGEATAMMLGCRLL